MIYTVTTLTADSIKSRCLGYFNDLSLAVRAVGTNALDMQENYYWYAVIEEVGDGLYFFPRREWWFRWNRKENKYVAIDKKPGKFNRIVCFGIG